MAVTDQLGAPGVEKQVHGKFTLARFVRVEADAAAPVVWTNIYGLQAWRLGDPTPDVSEPVFQQGGGNERSIKEFGYTWPVEIDFLKGDSYTELAAFYGQTFTSAGSAFLPFVKQNDYPKIHLEMIIRDSSNSTHLASILIPDLVIESTSWDHPIDASLITIKGYTRRLPGAIASGCEAVYDVFTGTGSTTAFTLSATPLTCETASNWQDLYYDNLLIVKEKATSASTGTPQTSGYSASGVTLTATAAPAASTKVQTLYIKAT